jgi:hypothetical protein
MNISTKKMLSSEHLTSSAQQTESGLVKELLELVGREQVPVNVVPGA